MATKDEIKKQKEKEYNDYVSEKMPKSPLLTGCLKAFLVGGIICLIGQSAGDFARYVLKYDEQTVGMFVSIVMVFLGATLTGLGIYDKIGRFAGGGSIIPITGFANSIVSPAMEFRHEGLVLGVGAKLFTVAGPVLVYGISSSVIVGIIYWLIGVL
ncbi:stage V sporulation protein AC [Clostridia bacterium OttesenSCG-928-F22]|nr:stage V sporulation protein AC [Clostridia bacterium OttesenSCG-928-F22]